MIEITLRNSDANYKLALINDIEWGSAIDLMDWPGVFTQRGEIMNDFTDERIYIIIDYKLN